MLKNILIFDKEKSNFDRNLRVKGEYLIKQIYDVLLDANDGQAVEWDDVLAVIKYDKSLRDKLYIFLASFEEYLKADIFRRYDVSTKEIIYDNKTLNKLKENIFSKTNDEQSNLYFCFKLELGPIIELIESKEMFDQNTIEKIKIIKNLRNKVMHHQVLLLGKSSTIEEAKEEVKILEKELETLYNSLSDEGYKSAFEKALNEQIGRKYMDQLKLGEMVNGVFK